MKSLQHSFAHFLCSFIALLGAFQPIYATGTNNFTVNLVDDPAGGIIFTMRCVEGGFDENADRPCLEIGDGGIIEMDLDLTTTTVQGIFGGPPPTSQLHYMVRCMVAGVNNNGLMASVIPINAASGTFYVEESIVLSAPSPTINFPSYPILFNTLPLNDFCAYTFTFEIYSNPPGTTPVLLNKTEETFATCHCEGEPLPPHMIPEIPCTTTEFPDRTAGELGMHSSNITELSVFPNPASSKAVLEYELKEAAEVRIELFDMQGRLLSVEQANVIQRAGQRQRIINIENLAPGIYHLRLVSTAEQKSIKIIKY